MDVFNRDPCHEATVCLFYILIELLDGPLSQDTEGYAHLVLSPVQVQGSMSNQEVDVGSHLLFKSCCPEVKCPPGLLLVELDILELGAANCLREGVQMEKRF